MKAIKLFKRDKVNNFVSTFDVETGFYVRSGIIDESGNDTGVDPFMTVYPELIDVGIMGHCEHAYLCEVGCYQGELIINVLTCS